MADSCEDGTPFRIPDDLQVGDWLWCGNASRKVTSVPGTPVEGGRGGIVGGWTVGGDRYYSGDPFWRYARLVEPPVLRQSGRNGEQA